ncbi:putative metal-dependent amidase aminoacylase carboxypeptidase protein [Neofusicoccum parvum UCRNP2]|uniref:Peptidase M20 domain-containing protein 2 n=1 Tax=Botryosphaeria parva (strain UCR-NP2) TaxID=1287680 RepID=R1G464_BOTPV|nr:putative metal-dependent amidase aminoacylase carboxypeptidase protein [Neofusicoccum parvum UCRNP2]
MTQVKIPAAARQSSVEEVRRTINSQIDRAGEALRALNRDIHDHPETAYQEVHAHDALTAFLESQGFSVTRHAYGLATAFEAAIGSTDAGAREVLFCAEYDALPGIGHACGHNLIATASVAAFVGAAKAQQALGFAGRIRILGTPAEEGGGGKIKLLDAGAIPSPTAAAIMAHPVAGHMAKTQGASGLAGFKLICSHKFRVEFTGRTAHAGAQPWDGLNALDAAVAAYTNVSMLRQQIRPDERVHGVIEDGGKVPNVIPEYTRMNWNVRAPTVKAANALRERVNACFHAAAAATGCKVNIIEGPMYKDLRANDTLCRAYVDDMAALGEKVILKEEEPATASTDMGNVSYAVPSFHGAFGIPAPKNVVGHHPGFAAAAATDEAHAAAIQCAKGMAMLGWRVLTDDAIADGARRDFEHDD